MKKRESVFVKIKFKKNRETKKEAHNHLWEGLYTKQFILLFTPKLICEAHNFKHRSVDLSPQICV